jgi:iron complex outermembrane receptor protein
LSGPTFSADPTSVSAGLLWNIDEKEVYTISSSLAYAERAASPVELFSDGTHFARRIRELGDPTLSKERSTGIDLAFRKNTGWLTASVTPFFQYFEDYINLQAQQGVQEEFPLYRYESVGANFWGGEFLSSLHVDELVPLNGHRFTIDLQSDMVRTRNRDTDGYIPRTPPLRNIIRARWELPRSVQFMTEGVFIESQRRLAAEELPTNGYGILNSEVSYAFREEDSPSLRVFLRGTNLTNEEARVHSSFLKDLAPLRGRSLLLGFRGTF